MSKVDQTQNLVDGQRRETLTQFLNRFSKVVAVHNSVGQNACATHNGSPRNLARDLFDQLASQPIDGIRIEVHNVDAPFSS